MIRAETLAQGHDKPLRREEDEVTLGAQICAKHLKPKSMKARALAEPCNTTFPMIGKSAARRH